MSIEVGALGSSSRVEAYSDAVFSIVSTVMILPVTHTKVPKDVDLSDFLLTKLPLFVVYLYSFFLVSSVWNIHVLLFDTIENADETLILLNLFLMMSTTFLPFTFYLTGEFPEDEYSILLYCGVTILVMVFMACMILYAFKVPGIQPIDFVINPDRVKRRNMMFLHVTVPLVLCVIAVMVAFLSPGLAAALFLGLIVFNIGIVRLLAWLIKVCRYRTNVLGARVPTLYEPRHVGKERVECFSDGVFAIVATILILDLCEDATKTDSHENVRHLLAEMSNTILAYFGSFVNIGLLWFVHHSTLHCFKEFSRVMSFFNMLCLASIGFFPFAFKMMNTYEDFEHVDYQNEKLAIQFAVSVVFVAGISQAIMWVIALQWPHMYLHSDGSYGGKHHTYTTVKLAIFPLFALFVYFIAFYLEEFTVHAFYAAQLIAPLLFISLRVIDLMVVNVRKRMHLARERRGQSMGVVHTNTMVPCDNLVLHEDDDDITM